MFDYGNTLGNGWILKTHYKKLIAEMKDQFSHFTPGKTSFMDKLKGKPSRKIRFPPGSGEKEKSCYICDYFKKEYARYLDTFFYLYKNDSVFPEKLTRSKGFCLHHFRDVLNGADAKLNDAEKKEFFPLVFGPDGRKHGAGFRRCGLAHRKIRLPQQGRGLENLQRRGTSAACRS